MVVVNTYFLRGEQNICYTAVIARKASMTDLVINVKGRRKIEGRRTPPQRSAEKGPVNIPTSISPCLPSLKFPIILQGQEDDQSVLPMPLAFWSRIFSRIYCNPPICELLLCLSPDQDSLSFLLCTTMIPVYRTIPETKQANPSYRKHVPVASPSSIPPSCQIISPNFPSSLWMAPSPSSRGSL